jgi:hypothetical protein
MNECVKYLYVTYLILDFFRLLSQCAEKYGDIFRLWVGQRPFVFLYRAETVQVWSMMLHFCDVTEKRAKSFNVIRQMK